MKHYKQLDRIKLKLELAKKRDPYFRAFGAGHHRYHLGPPLSEEEVRAFEEKRGITLPSCYRAFITHLGDGGPGYENGAGPHYGIYPLSKGGPSPDILPEYISERPLIYPDIPYEEWKRLKNPVDIYCTDVSKLTDCVKNTDLCLDQGATSLKPGAYYPYVRTSGVEATPRLTQRCFFTQSVSDEELAHGYSKLFQGMLCIETQGCTYYTMLVVVGEHKGRVVHVDESLGYPAFDKERNFLDWYEKWLDKVLFESDELGFDFLIEGTEMELINIFNFTDKQHYKLTCLHGLANFPRLSPEGIKVLNYSSLDNDNRIAETAISILSELGPSGEKIKSNQKKRGWLDSLKSIIKISKQDKGE